jgi:integrase
MPTVHFTAQTVKGLSAGSAVRTDYFDTDVTGFGLRVTASGIKTWIYIYRIHTRPRRYTIGRYPDLSLADARDRAKTARNEVARGVDPSATKMELRRAETFGELADQYVKEYAKPRKRTWLVDQTNIARSLGPWRHVKAVEIRRRDVIALLKAIADKGSPIKANRIQSLIRKIFNWAIGLDLIENNPCVGVVRFGKEHRRTRILNEEEIFQFWEAAEAHWRGAIGTPVGAILQLELLTAQRGQEVRWMRWSDLDVATGWWTLPGEFAKNGTTSRVALNRSAVRLIRELHALAVARHAEINEGRGRKGWDPKPMSNWVFPRRRPGKETVEGEDLPVRWTQNEFALIRRASGAAHFTPHDLRRTAATRIPVDGPQESRRFIIKRILNHADREVTAIYDLYSYDAEKKRAIDAWGKYLERLLRKTGLRRVG